ncbi:class I SAM-dependent methyltransferase [Oscillibacter sp.]|uniref:class I SAM-dependent DNA methyltransferase n=1 Tax=Oscillibacter sp. TaxID=1945593 RepID=UPI002896FF06|nr:class I SAM-dependent methyltransferase [Oscillibacter sp.]
MSRYRSLAGAYDGLVADGAHRKRAAYLHRLLQKETQSVETVLDLGCGTGTVTCLLAALGYRMVGADLSEEMLTEAARKAEALPEDRRPLLICQSMSRLRLAEPVDAAVSTLDALNYVTGDAAMRETLRRVFKWLRPGGLFMFDVNTPYKLRRMDGEMYTDETEDSFCVWRTAFSEKTRVCTYGVDLFSLRPDGTWDRSWEEHRERAWEEDELRSLLEAAGFRDIRITGDLRQSAPRPDEDRVIFRCRKPESSQKQPQPRKRSNA